MNQKQPVSKEYMQPQECHISSLVVHCNPERVAQVVADIEQLKEAEIYAQEGGKLVVVIESVGKNHILETVEKLNNIAGVINASMVYHQFEKLDVQCEDNKL
ncbi:MULTISPECIES: chaperone NapD [unclassified Motilimonas]|uniref:chaperone NapD n=1 Tax=Motilimonas TaxID=1914248 RepID=UPI001E5F49E7|nr:MULTISPECIES: chaperone NapD [unclassified Motilimonas]MCE0558810.1 chaperone NapD [Motilimonas sp. E26]MDO6526521.1 chaperone NapD [Motilimonas sp. 1_MG-2023]